MLCQAAKKQNDQQEHSGLVQEGINCYMFTAPWYKFVLHGWLEGLIRSTCMCRNGNKRNVRKGGIQEWILKVSQKNEEGKGIIND